MNDLLVVDSDFLCHRAENAMGHLRNVDARTGVLFGYIKQLDTLRELYPGRTVVHCFNYGKNVRFGVYPEYLGKRKEARQKDYFAMNDEAREEALFRWKEFDRQRNELRETVLPLLGYSNVLFADGFESDDIMASVAQSAKGVETTIVTSDRDLWQCIQPAVTVYDPNKDKEYTVEVIVEEWGIKPSEWWKVKVLAGCNTDSVPGIRGVGEKTAVQYLLHKASPAKTVLCDSFRKTPEFKRNIQLIKLPFKGTPQFDIEPDTVTHAKRRHVAQKLGFRKI